MDNQDDNQDNTSLTFILKIQENQRQITSKLTDRIHVIKVREFPSERVRFIYQGRELVDHKLLSDCGLVYGCIVHCIVRSGIDNFDEANSRDQQGFGYDNSNSDTTPVGSILQALIGVILLLFWMLYFNLSEYFERSAFIMLTALSAIYSLSIVQFFFSASTGSSTSILTT